MWNKCINTPDYSYEGNCFLVCTAVKTLIILQSSVPLSEICVSINHLALIIDVFFGMKFYFVYDRKPSSYLLWNEQDWKKKQKCHPQQIAHQNNPRE